MAGSRRNLSNPLSNRATPVLSQSELAQQGSTEEEYEVLTSNEEETPTEPIGVPISELPGADTPTGNDAIPGVQADETVQYALSDLLAWIIGETTPADIGAVPTSRTVNSKPLSADISLTASDVGARPDNWTPSAGDVGAQPTINVSGILKGDGSGGISAAVAGTDYATPASIPSAYTSNPEMDGTASPGSSGSWAKGDHVHPSDTSKANQAQLAYVEAGSTASRNYSAGEFFCWNGSLYQATAAISSGASFNSGSGGNCKSVYASDYSAGTWAPITTNATVIANAPERNGYARYGSLLVIYIALELKADLANLSQIDICDDVAGEMGVSSVLTPFANAPAFSVQRSAGSSDIILRVQYNSNKLTLINRSGTVASKTNRFIYGYIPLAVL